MSDRLTWSTRQVAALAGTTQKAVRYYHSVGLLAEPERGVNGYKHYGVAVASRVLDDQSVAQLRDLLARHEPTDTDEELTQLPDDATPEQIEDLARRIVAQVQGAKEHFPSVTGTARGAVPRRLAHEAVAAAMVESFRAAQLRVLVRVSELAAAAPGEIPAP